MRVFCAPLKRRRRRRFCRGGSHCGAAAGNSPFIRPNRRPQSGRRGGLADPQKPIWNGFCSHCLIRRNRPRKRPRGRHDDSPTSRGSIEIVLSPPAPALSRPTRTAWKTRRQPQRNTCSPVLRAFGTHAAARLSPVRSLVSPDRTRDVLA